MPNFNRKSKPLLAVLALIIIGVFVFFIYRLQLGRTDTVKLTNSAQRAFDSGDFNRARDDFAKALKQNPGNQKLLAGVINAIAGKGNASGREAAASIEAAPYVKAAASSGDKDVLIALGYLAETGGDYTKALDYYNKALKKDEKYARTWFRLGHANEFLGNSAEAFADYDKAYAIDPNDSQIILQQGVVALQKGKLDDASKFFLSAAAGATQNFIKAEAWTSAAQIKEAQGALFESKDLAALAVGADRNYGPGLVEYGRNLAIEGRYHDGSGFIAEAMQTNPRSAQPYWAMGTLFRAVKDYDKGVTYFKQALDKIASDNTIVGEAQKVKLRAQVTYDLAKTYSLQGKNADALNTLEEAVKLNKDVVILIKNDNKLGFFKDVSGDPRFTALIK